MSKKTKIPKVDGEITQKELNDIRKSIRQRWGWSSIARKNCIKRATDKDGFGHCEKCKRKVPKVFADHIRVMGDVLAPDYIKRMWCHSSKLQALCQKCHNKKTKIENDAARKDKHLSLTGSFPCVQVPLKSNKRKKKKTFLDDF